METVESGEGITGATVSEAGPLNAVAGVLIVPGLAVGLCWSEPHAGSVSSRSKKKKKGLIV